MAPLMAVAAIAGAGLQAIGTIQSGKAQQAALNFEAQQRERKATEERAASQRDAIGKETEGKRVLSRQVALAAASGAGSVNPSILDIYGDTAAQSDYNQRVALYGGESRARGELDNAAAARAKGKAAYRGSVFDAAGGFLSGLSKADFG